MSQVGVARPHCTMIIPLQGFTMEEERRHLLLKCHLFILTAPVNVPQLGDSGNPFILRSWCGSCGPRKDFGM